MTRASTNDDSTKAAALKLLRRGLITQSEAARLAGVSRQLVRYWVRELDTDQAREATLRRIWDRATRRPK